MLPVDPNSGLFAFATNLGNESDMTLTHEFDFSNASGPVTLSYSTWYDVEKDYDYVFVEVSEDGEHWKIVNTPSGTADNPSGNSYGWGYNGKSDGWIKEDVDLSAYAGKKVQVRFEYVTDAAVTGEGFMLDDISVDAVNYKTDLETDDGGWKAEGFSRVENIIPQTYRLSLITKNADGTKVEPVELNPDQTAEIPLSLKDGEEATLLVTGTTRYTRKSTAYQLEVK
jgi:bacillopeptidase F (M6 metalloprotease family)